MVPPATLATLCLSALVQVIAATATIAMMTVAASILGSDEEEKELVLWHGVSAFVFASAVAFCFGVARILKTFSTGTVSATLAVLASLVTINMVFASAICIASNKTEKVASLTVYIWAMSAMTGASVLAWFLSKLPALFGSQGRLTAFSAVALVNMLLRAAWSVAGHHGERMACLWVGVFALGGCSVIALSYAVLDLIELSLKDPELSKDISVSSRLMAWRMRRAS